MFCRTRRLRPRLARVHEPDLDRARPRRRAARHHRRHPARPLGDARDRAADDDHDQAAGEQRDPGPDLLVRRRALRRLAHRDPAQHPRHRRQRRVVRRRLRAGAARRGRPGDRHRHLGRVHRHAVRRDLPGRVHAVARRGRARLRRVRVLLAGPVRRRDVRLDRRRRPGQGLADGRARPVRRPDRPGGPLRLRPLHLRLGRARRRHRA